MIRKTLIAAAIFIAAASSAAHAGPIIPALVAVVGLAGTEATIATPVIDRGQSLGLSVIRNMLK